MKKKKRMNSKAENQNQSINVKASETSMWLTGTTKSM